MKKKTLIIAGLTVAYFCLFGASIWQGFRLVNENTVSKVNVCAEDTAVCAASELPKQKKIKNSKDYKSISLAGYKGIARSFTYSVITKGNISASVADFETKANATLNDSRGWGEAARFTQVDSGGDFTLVLSEARFLPSFSSACSASWSCRTGRYVVINQDRWLGASAAWNGSGGSLRDYQHMVVNHEVGHWLGHGHSSCGGAGQKAPVMQQQSINLQGCKFNPWPLPSEVASIR